MKLKDIFPLFTNKEAPVFVETWDSRICDYSTVYYGDVAGIPQELMNKTIKYLMVPDPESVVKPYRTFTIGLQDNTYLEGGDH